VPHVKLSSFSQQIGRNDESNIPWVPEENDSSPRAVDWRARRAMRIAVDVRETIGHPTTTDAAGKLDPATGLWGLLEPLRAMADDWNEQKKARSSTVGFFAKRGVMIFDRVLVVLALTLLGYLTRHSWLPTGEPSPAQQTEKKS
jgi:hypothetical protein